MITRAKTWFAERSPREQRLLAVMLALLVMTILWFGIIAPLNTAREEAAARLDQATLTSGRVNAAAEALRLATLTPPTKLTTSLAATIASSATEAGFMPSRLDPQAADRVIIAIPSAKAPALFAWLDTLARRGIFAEKSSVRPNSDATIGFEATLRLRRR